MPRWTHGAKHRIDKTSLFQRRERAPDKSTAKRVFVLALRAQQRIDLPDILDQLTPRSRWNAPRLRREMLDDFHRISHTARARSYNFNNA